MITKEELINLLNKDIEDEYGAAIQYVQHASVITGAEYQSIQKELVVHANEEMGHAILLSEQVAYLGGVPSVDVSKRWTSTDSREMLEQDIAGERAAIKNYSERVKQSEELGLYGLTQVLRQILADEEEHERDLQMSLGE